MVCVDIIEQDDETEQDQPAQDEGRDETEQEGLDRRQTEMDEVANFIDDLVPVKRMINVMRCCCWGLFYILPVSYYYEVMEAQHAGVMFSLAMALWLCIEWFLVQLKMEQHDQRMKTVEAGAVGQSIADEVNKEREAGDAKALKEGKKEEKKDK